MDHGINQDGQINKHKGEKEYANRVQNLKNKITNEVSLLELRVVRLFSPICVICQSIKEMPIFTKI